MSELLSHLAYIYKDSHRSDGWVI